MSSSFNEPSSIKDAVDDSYSITYELTLPNSLFASPIKQANARTTKRDLSKLVIEDPVMMHVKSHTFGDNKNSHILLK